MTWPARTRMLTRVKRSLCSDFNIERIIVDACGDILREHHYGHTECVYEKLLAEFLYSRCIPYMTQVDCFIQKNRTQVHVGRIDLEVAHCAIVELKVAPGIKAQDVCQLMKYVRAKEASGFEVKHALIVCFCPNDVLLTRSLK